MSLKRLTQNPLLSLWMIPLYFILMTYLILAIYAPFFASAHPIWVKYQGENYFPLFRHLLNPQSYTQTIDLFFNLFIFSFPVLLPLFILSLRKNSSYRSTIKIIIGLIGISQIIIFILLQFSSTFDLMTEPKHYVQWDFSNEKSQFTPHEKIDLLWKVKRRDIMDKEIAKVLIKKSASHLLSELPQALEKQSIQKRVDDSHDTQYKNYLKDRQAWIQEESQKLEIKLKPLLRLWHWEENTGLDQNINRYLPWYKSARINRKDLCSALIFGTRISLVVGIITVILSLIIGIPLGAISAYVGGRWDLLFMRAVEIWEAFPSFFMLLFITAILQKKSILLIIILLALFSWTPFARFIRGEVLKQKVLPYRQACQGFGLKASHILFWQILPNCLSPVLTLIPFAVMGAISSEAGLSFLGLGEEGSCSWGTLMDEGRGSFPAESHLLWPPAIAITILLVTLAIIGDKFRDYLDPKLKF